MNRQILQRGFRVPTVVLALGLLSISLLLWITYIEEEQYHRLSRLEAIEAMQFRLGLSHLWLEEFIAGEKSIAETKVWEDMDAAVDLFRALRDGGATEHGTPLGPVVDERVRAQLDVIGVLLARLKSLTAERLREPQRAGIGTELDRSFNAVFKEVIHRASSIQKAAVEDMIVQKARSVRLLIGTLLTWFVVIVLAIVGFWRREVRLQAAREALQEARDDLKRRVEERTRDLSSANERLQQEVGERRRAEEGLRIYEEVVHNMPLGLYVLQSDGLKEEGAFRVIATNRSASLASSVAPEDVLGKPVLESFPWFSDTVAPRICAEVVRSGKSEDLRELCFTREQGPDGFFSVKIFPLPHDCVGVLFEDITEQKTAEDALRESERKFRKLSLEFHSLLDAISDPILLLSPKMEIVWSNKGAADMLGQDFCNLATRTCHQVWHDASEPCEDCPTLRSFASGRSESVEVNVSEGEYWNIRAYPVRDETGQVVNVIEMITDVSDRVAFQAEAMRTAHLTSLGKLAAGVAHEVNNPVNAMINYAQILSNRSEKGTEQHDISNRIIKEGMRVSRIVNGLLAFARERREEKTAVDVNEILKDSLTLSESLILKQGIRLSVDLPGDLPEIVANPQQIQQVFLNLISNARYALNEKYPDSHDDKILEIRGLQGMLEGHPCVFVSFRDHGCGIPKDAMEKIMLPFFSTKPAGKGTGLGLAVSLGIVEDHGGKLMVDSVENQWTEVVVALPAKDRDESKHPHRR